MRLNLGIDALIRAGYERVALFDLRIDTTVSARPVRVFAKQTHAPRNKDLHGRLLYSMLTAFTRDASHEQCQESSPAAIQTTKHAKNIKDTWQGRIL